MASPQDMPEVPDLEEFARRIDEAASAAEDFAAAASQPAAQTAGTSQSAQVKDDPIQRDILNALHLIHDELVALKQIIENMSG